jgi:DNA polymerase (family 10)
MTVSNRYIASIFNEVANLLDIEGANPFRVRAYRNAARTVLSSPRSMADLVAEGFDLTSLKGIGKELSEKIIEIVTTGKLAFLERLERRTSPELETLLKIPGLGPKRVHLLHETLHIDSLQDLRKALEKGELEKLPGFGPKLIATIEQGLKSRRYDEKRHRLCDTAPIAEEIVSQLRRATEVVQIAVAGSIRRRKETVHDIDIVAACKPGSDIMERFVGLDGVEKVLMKGPTRSSILLREGLQVDVRVVPPGAYGAALHHFTGAKAHTIALRRLARQRGIKINEYGLFRDERLIAGADEGDIYQTLGMAYVEPELRENRGEIALAQQDALPRLIEESDIRGDLHIHTLASDGAETIEAMALAARKRGYAYLAITDHTKHLTLAHGLDEKRMRAQLETIDRLNETLEGITILKSAEVDILEGGELDLDERILAELDLLVCGIHYKFNLSKKAQTQRILRAMENPHFTILAHPTGRLLGLREGYDVDMEAIVRACAQRGCILELNAQPDRLDLDDIHCKMAKEAGVPVAISTDAHALGDLDLMRCGIGQARRGWLEKEDVVNTKSLEALQEMLGRIKG